MNADPKAVPLIQTKQRDMNLINIDFVLLPLFRTNILAKLVMNTVLKERQNRRDGI
jgi:hypothetical protein